MPSAFPCRQHSLLAIKKDIDLVYNYSRNFCKDTYPWLFSRKARTQHLKVLGDIGLEVFILLFLFLFFFLLLKPVFLLSLIGRENKRVNAKLSRSSTRSSHRERERERLLSKRCRNAVISKSHQSILFARQQVGANGQKRANPCERLLPLCCALLPWSLSADIIKHHLSRASCWSAKQYSTRQQNKPKKHPASSIQRLASWQLF